MARHFTSLSDPELIEMISSGAIGVIATDTVYGLVASARSETAIARMYAVKSRERQPGTTIAASTTDLELLGFPKSQLSVASKFWPNAVSVEMDAHDVPTYLSTGQQKMAARIPNVYEILKLLQLVGPLMTTSANAPHQPTSTSINQAVDYFCDEVDFYVDGGDLSGRPPSTIIGVTPSDGIVIYRQGAVDVELLNS